MDYRTAVNPTYFTAQATVFMLAGAGNADAQEFITTRTRITSVNSQANEQQNTKMYKKI